MFDLYHVRLIEGRVGSTSSAGSACRLHSRRGAVWRQTYSAVSFVSTLMLEGTVPLKRFSKIVLRIARQPRVHTGGINRALRSEKGVYNWTSFVSDVTTAGNGPRITFFKKSLPQSTTHRFIAVSQTVQLAHARVHTNARARAHAHTHTHAHAHTYTHARTLAHEARKAARGRQSAAVGRTRCQPQQPTLAAGPSVQESERCERAHARWDGAAYAVLAESPAPTRH
jgi:hypothetical protein